jgi:DNA-directed RNA polymerase specialized sigma24 family protein
LASEADMLRPSHGSPSMTQPDWPRLIERHQHAVVLALLARGVRLRRARELAQDAFGRLYEAHRLGRLEAVQLPGLAIRQATFLLLQELRPAHLPLEAAPEVLALEAGGGTPEQHLQARQALERTRAALQRCSPRARALYELQLDHPELAHAELAPRAGVSLQRFRQTLCEVRARLRAALEGGRP